jgi:hypothetical protein
MAAIPVKPRRLRRGNDRRALDGIVVWVILPDHDCPEGLWLPSLRSTRRPDGRRGAGRPVPGDGLAHRSRRSTLNEAGERNLET